MSKVAVVVPTIRKDSINAWLKAWEPIKDHVELIVVEDNPEKTFNITWGSHYSWKEIDEDLGNDRWIIPRRSAGIRVYGFLKALEMGADYVWNLDDDCYPEIDPVETLKQHLSNFEEKDYIRWSSVDVNQRMTRGVPFTNTSQKVKPVVSHGTWTHNADYDAVHQLANRYPFEPFEGIIPRYQYFAFSGMNYMFDTKLTWLLYHAPYGERIDGTKYPYSRFDDIWMGVIFKKIADLIGLYVYSGKPQVKHIRASNAIKNLQEEAKAMPINEGFWGFIDQLNISVQEGDLIKDVVGNIANHLKTHEDSYFAEYAKALKVWARLVVERGKYE